MASGTGIGEFFVSLTVDAAAGQLNVSNLVQTFGELEVTTLAEIGLLWELGVQLAKIVDASVQSALGFKQFTMHTDLSAQVLQKWQIVARQSHASAEDVTGSVENLTKHMANLGVGIPDAALGSLQQLGINARDSSGKMKDAFQILGEVRQRLGVVTSDAGQQERILAGLGVSANLRETLLLADTAFNSRAALAHGMGIEQEKQFDAMYTRFQQIELVAKDIANDIASWSSPAVMSFLDKELEALKSLRWFWENSKGSSGDVRGSRMKEVAFQNSPIGKLLGPSDDQAYLNVLINSLIEGLRRSISSTPSLPPEPPGGFRPAAPTIVNVDKHDVYNIHDAHDPEAVKGVIEKHWDDIMARKTVDGFDRQNNNGGY